MMVTYAAIMAGQMSVAFADVTTGTLFLLAGILFCASLIPTAVFLSAISPQPLADVSLDFSRSSLPTSPVGLPWLLSCSAAAEGGPHGERLRPVLWLTYWHLEFRDRADDERGGAGGRGRPASRQGVSRTGWTAAFVTRLRGAGFRPFSPQIIFVSAPRGRDNHHRARRPI